MLKTAPSDQNTKQTKEKAKKRKDEEEKKEEEDTDYPYLSKFFVPKPFTDHESNPCAKLTRYVEVTIQELYDKVMHDVKQLHRKPSEDEICPICMCSLYDDRETMPEA